MIGNDTKPTPEAILQHLDEQIRGWRENFTLVDERLQQRGIDAVDALQQFRLIVFGALLPQDDGSYAVFRQHGKSGLITVSTEEEAKAIIEEERVLQ